MCFFSAPKITPPPPPAQTQAMQSPKDQMQDPRSGSSKLRRRGLWASVFTGPQGITGAPSVTGSTGGLTGG
jgi:hypothetical protein